MDETLPPATTARFDRAVIAVGVALLTAVVALSGIYTRFRDDDIDWTNYLVGIAATVVLLGVSVVTWLRSTPDRADDLVAWPGALGIVGVGVMLWQALDDSEATAYVVGVVILAVAAIGYLLCRRWPFVVVGIAGLATFYIQLVVDLFDDVDAGGENFGLIMGAAIFVFTLLVTAAVWFLPERSVGGVVVGVAAVVGLFLTLFWLSTIAILDSAFDEGDPFVTPERSNPFENDVWFIIAFSLLLAAMWAWAAWQTGHVGFRLLVVAICTAVIPPATLALAVEHPTYWGAILGVFGTAALGWLLLRSLLPSLRPQG